jgi:hypothetical protein
VNTGSARNRGLLNDVQKIAADVEGEEAGGNGQRRMNEDGFCYVR